MSALADALEAQFEPITVDKLPAIMPIEQEAYTHPWTAGNFADSLRAGYQAQQLVAQGQVLGYFVAMKGVDEVHLLNLTVAARFQRQGWAQVMLDALALWSRGQGALWLWLEVRASNARAQQVYEAHGYRRVGLRKRYYPSHGPEREDAIVMSLRLWS
ncbi:ribosomal protein S18-alanine N-acetyltransferase [Xylophilus rhododendri]|uniref:[Ribosomal protein bS18]-alanine N-acetyltransferase n=1 Tax=Xylophilus rhododendri TaxID=2697032 RepID=A0A857J788_9BURK|nr:ribosomal protein S18-alanine N-acetyltransferase [Xylophilus rhododendri]QHI98911.1 ribosomal protein S18-alanine N-acetyltransferase [Xylophilus rhododendri]